MTLLVSRHPAQALKIPYQSRSRQLVMSDTFFETKLLVQVGGSSVWSPRGDVTTKYFLNPNPLNPEPKIPNPTPYTLHPSPHTLHPTPYTLHHTP